MQGGDLRDGLDLDDYLVLHHQIGAKSHFKAGPFVYHGYRLLPGKVQASLREMPTAALSISPFERSRWRLRRTRDAMGKAGRLVFGWAEQESVSAKG